MFINLTDIESSENDTVNMQVEAEMTTVSVGRETFPILEKSPVRLKFTRIGKHQVAVDGQATFIFRLYCDRCLQPVEEKLVLSFSRKVQMPDVISEPADEAALEEDDQSFMEGYQLDVEGLLNNEIIINWPRKVLCRPDCKGICLQCGKDLNAGSCECDTFVPDPRMAVIKDIFSANKEV